MPAGPSGSRRDASFVPVGIHRVNVVIFLSAVADPEYRQLAHLLDDG